MNLNLNLIKTTLILSSIISSNLYAYKGIQDYETTRLKSTAGAGIGSILLNEAVILNPASIGFMQQSSIVYQKDRNKLQNESESRISDHKNGNSELIIITDTSSTLNGGISYQYQNIEAGKRLRVTGTAAHPISKSTVLGFGLNYTKEESTFIDSDYTHLTIGLSHVESSELSYGFVLKDPAQTAAEYFEAGFGFQYNFNKFFSAIVDIGTGDVANYEDHSYRKYALQLNSFKDWFFRYGQYENKSTNYKGIGYGASWVGPRFSLDYAYKISEQIDENIGILYSDEKIAEYSFSIVVLL